ncbi:nicotinate-nucleotide--dimethylbenzimidazole phosphoribosyltransferase [Streptomyces cavernae]|uniref:nicotinate-nucleotide--dimethylbenzimidazole phosphoribosyltransferase n=1 Tax=Streptomyces cavernae TaxID=2259034 RepID=UPI000FEB61D4|nr:nicotinate-nucleotide--dimethylbenzimidazole phosphoribosyltransferase [Streptomyces cavernae]
MTDTGQVPGEGLPENAGMGEPPGVSTPTAYTFLDPTENTMDDDDLLLLPGAQGAWVDSPPAHAAAPGHDGAAQAGAVAHTPPGGQAQGGQAQGGTGQGETVQGGWPSAEQGQAAPTPHGAHGAPAAHEPGPHETAGRDSGSVDVSAVRTPPPAATPTPPPAPRRPLHLGPPTPDSTGSLVRSLADRGPAGAPVRPMGPPTTGPEYLDVPRDTVHASRTLHPAPQHAEVPSQGGTPWGAPTNAETVVPGGEEAPAEAQNVPNAPAAQSPGAGVQASGAGAQAPEADVQVPEAGVQVADAAEAVVAPEAGEPVTFPDAAADTHSSPDAEPAADTEEPTAHGEAQEQPHTADAHFAQAEVPHHVPADGEVQVAEAAGDMAHGGPQLPPQDAGLPVQPADVVQSTYPAETGLSAEAAFSPEAARFAQFADTAQQAHPAEAGDLVPDGEPPRFAEAETAPHIADDASAEPFAEAEALPLAEAQQPEAYGEVPQQPESVTAVAEPPAPADTDTGVDADPVPVELAVAAAPDAQETATQTPSPAAPDSGPQFTQVVDHAQHAAPEGLQTAPEPAPAETEPAVEAPEPALAEPQITDAQTAEPQITDAQNAEPQITDAQNAEPQITDAQNAEPQAVQPEAAEPQVVDPEAVQPEAVQPEAPELDAAPEPAPDPVAAAETHSTPEPTATEECTDSTEEPTDSAEESAESFETATDNTDSTDSTNTMDDPVRVPAQREAEQPAPAAPDVPEPTVGEPLVAQQAEDLETRAAETEESAAAVAETTEPPGPAAPGYAEAEREAVLRVMRERRDIRNGFRSDPIPHDVLLRVLEAAHTAPSVGHSQPWDFVVIRSADTRRTMHELAMRQRDAYAKSLPKGRAKQFKELKIEAILDTPVNIVVTADPTRGGRHTLGRHTQPQMAPYSSALAVENLWLAARAEGLGVGWVSFFDEREMVRTLGLPEHLEVVAYLCVGYVDEFPEEPELMQAGWSKRRPLSWVVHEETYGRRALPGEEPHDLLAETVSNIRPLDAKALGEAWERQKRMTKPAGALGMLEIISAQLSGLSRQCPPPIPEPAAVAIFAGDHGVHAQGVTPWPQEVTAQMVANFLGGGAVCNAFANQVGAEVCVVDVGVASDLPATPGLLPRKVRAGTADMTAGPALTREEVKKAIEVGIETARDLVAAGNKALLTGEMGIANTTASAALIAVFTDTDPSEVTGRGTGINDETLARKTEVVRRAIELHQPDPADPIGVLAAFGGLEHAAMVGLLLGGASLRTPVILDGVSAGAAALVARAIAPEVLAACIAGHRSAEPGHVAALKKLGLRPLVDLDLRLGEGTGALLALPVVQSAARAMHEVATFDSAGVTEK